VFTAGEVFVRKHMARFGDSQVPLALELIEAERLADEFTAPVPGGAGPNVRLGVEGDAFGRPTAYWIREVHPGALRITPEQTARLIRVPAADIIHIRIIDRWPQTRGEPWLHAVLRKLNDLEEYSGAELVAARMSANYFATIESAQDDPLPDAKKADDGSKQINIEPGVIEQLTPGDKLEFHTPNRPNTALDPFMRYMLREVAAGTGVSYESLSRDYSQSNYSSSRLALLDDRDLWRVLQAWWIRTFREPLHRTWLQQAGLARAIAGLPVDQYALDPERYAAVRWKLRGWSWVDPTKEVTAFKEAVKAGFTTVSAVIAATGGGVDIEDVIAERKEELELLEEAGIEVDTTVAEVVPPAPINPKPAADDEPAATDDDAPAPARVMSIAR
jgi:lambda family phage portal protein